jgi:hypothetical protein
LFDTAGQRRVLLEVLHGRTQYGLAREWDNAGKQLEKHHTHRVDVMSRSRPQKQSVWRFAADTYG